MVCFKEDSDDIVALNILGIETLDEYPPNLDATPYPLSVAFGAVDFIMQKFNIMKHYNVNEYMSGLGLIVLPKYRGKGIAMHMLKARQPLCKAIGISLTSTSFTEIGSQIPATRAGYVTDVEITYDELTKKGFHFPNVKSKFIKQMSLIIQ